MFRVLIEEFDNRGPGKKRDLTIKTEKLYELLGRYTVKYGAPTTLVPEEEGISEYEYMKHYDTGFIGIQVSFAKIANESKLNNVMDIKPPSPPINIPAVVEEPMEERMVLLVASGTFKRSWA